MKERGYLIATVQFSTDVIEGDPFIPVALNDTTQRNTGE